MGKRFKKRFKSFCCWKDDLSDTSDTEVDDTKATGSKHIQQQPTKVKTGSPKMSKADSIMQRLDEKYDTISKAMTDLERRLNDLARMNDESLRKYIVFKDSVRQTHNDLLDTVKMKNALTKDLNNREQSTFKGDTGNSDEDTINKCKTILYDVRRSRNKNLDGLFTQMPSYASTHPTYVKQNLSSFMVINDTCTMVCDRDRVPDLAIEPMMAKNNCTMACHRDQVPDVAIEPMVTNNNCTMACHRDQVPDVAIEPMVTNNNCTMACHRDEVPDLAIEPMMTNNNCTMACHRDQVPDLAIEPMMTNNNCTMACHRDEVPGLPIEPMMAKNNNSIEHNTFKAPDFKHTECLSEKVFRDVVTQIEWNKLVPRLGLSTYMNWKYFFCTNMDTTCSKVNTCCTSTDEIFGVKSSLERLSVLPDNYEQTEKYALDSGIIPRQRLESGLTPIVSTRKYVWSDTNNSFYGSDIVSCRHNTVSYKPIVQLVVGRSLSRTNPHITNADWDIKMDTGRPFRVTVEFEQAVGLFQERRFTRLTFHTTIDKIIKCISEYLKPQYLMALQSYACPVGMKSDLTRRNGLADFTSSCIQLRHVLSALFKRKYMVRGQLVRIEDVLVPRHTRLYADKGIVMSVKTIHRYTDRLTVDSVQIQPIKDLNGRRINRRLGVSTPIQQVAKEVKESIDFDRLFVKQYIMKKMFPTAIVGVSNVHTAMEFERKSDGVRAGIPIYCRIQRHNFVSNLLENPRHIGYAKKPMVDDSSGKTDEETEAERVSLMHATDDVNTKKPNFQTYPHEYVHSLKELCRIVVDNLHKYRAASNDTVVPNLPEVSKKESIECGDPGSDKVKLAGHFGDGDKEKTIRLRVSPRRNGPPQDESRQNTQTLLIFKSILPEVTQGPLKEYHFLRKTRPMLSLRDLIKKGCHFDEHHAKFISINLMTTLKFLLTRRIIHADICPEKVIFNDKGYPCLTGYENSEIIGSDISRVPSAIPRLEYCSPEQFCKHGHVTEATDVFSTGVLVYTMMYGRSPHKGINYQKTKSNLLKDTFIPTFKPDGVLSWGGKLFLALCIRNNPDKRFSLKKCKSSLVDSIKWFRGFDETKLANQSYPSPFLMSRDGVNKRV